MWFRNVVPFSRPKDSTWTFAIHYFTYFSPNRPKRQLHSENERKTKRFFLFSVGKIRPGKADFVLRCWLTFLQPFSQRYLSLAAEWLDTTAPLFHHIFLFAKMENFSSSQNKLRELGRKSPQAAFEKSMENFETAFQCLILDFETLRGKVGAFKSADFFRVIACNAILVEMGTNLIMMMLPTILRQKRMMEPLAKVMYSHASHRWATFVISHNHPR